MAITPVPGDPSTEPVATAEQSHVEGRVGPPTIAQDADADWFVPEGVEQVEPGEEKPADYPWKGGRVGNTDVEADATPGNDEPQDQRDGPVTSRHSTATRRASDI